MKTRTTQSWFLVTKSLKMVPALSLSVASTSAIFRL
uniref:Uncharacterized protein n=1 Tax=Rhizophora mucronata TaxID=61149 RepID=A0A2P2LH83_RHIMU